MPNNVIHNELKLLLERIAIDKGTDPYLIRVMLEDYSSKDDTSGSYGYMVLNSNIPIEQKWRYLNYLLDNRYLKGIEKDTECKDILTRGRSEVLGEWISLGGEACMNVSGIFNSIYFNCGANGAAPAIEKKLLFTLDNLINISKIFQLFFTNEVERLIANQRSIIPDEIGDHPSWTDIALLISSASITIKNGQELGTIHLETSLDPEHGMDFRLYLSMDNAIAISK